MKFLADNPIKKGIARWTIAGDVKKLYRNKHFDSELLCCCFMKHGKFVSSILQSYLSDYGDSYREIENVWVGNDKNGIKICYVPQKDYQVEYNNYYDVG